MATKSEVFDDSKSYTTSPPPYNNISTFAPSADSSIKCTAHRLLQPFLPAAFLRNKQHRKIILSRIRDIVSAPDVTPSSVAPTVNACATALSHAELSVLLQKPNIEDHSAMYWAIVNNRGEALAAFSAFIPKFSSVCSSELRLACMLTGNHALFMQLNLGRVINLKDDSLRRFLHCPPDEVEVHNTGNGLRHIQFVAYFGIKMFKKRMLMTQELGVEFVAEGRIWLLRVQAVADGRWCIVLSLAQPSSPACLDVELALGVHSDSGCATPSHLEEDIQMPDIDWSGALTPIGSSGPLDSTIAWPLEYWLKNQ